MRKFLIVSVLLFTLPLTTAAEELFKVTLHSERDAFTLDALGVDVVLWVRGGYVVLADRAQAKGLYEEGLDAQLLASNVHREQLAMDGRFDRKNADLFEVLYEEDRLRLLLAGEDRLALTDRKVEVFPLPDRQIEIIYNPPDRLDLPKLSETPLGVIDDLIALVEQDSVEAYNLRLEAFYRRLTGTDSNYAARDWIYSKFVEFGYDSVYIDPFTGSQLWEYDPVPAFNVVATKVGSVYPDQHVIIGGHFDAVPDCPGADDNASGTVATLEVARVLAEIETERTIVFIAFDSEESWLWGSYHYVDGVLQRNDDIVLMINVDMIGHWDNDTWANLYTGPVTAYAQLWNQLASTYVGITGDLSGTTASDHYPFQENGYDVVFVHEGNFSTEYHQPSDSTVYMNFEYMTRMVQATLATLYSVSESPRAFSITQLRQGGDGISVHANWPDCNDPSVAEYRVGWFQSGNPSNILWATVPSTDTCYLITGLTEGTEYGFFVQAVDNDFLTSAPFYQVKFMTPSSIPQAPFNIQAMPLLNAIDISWDAQNTELDFDHCDVIRDGTVIGQTLDSVYIDSDPTLGADIHYYYVTAVDTDGNHSDTVGIDPVWMKVATLAPDRILAVNRSCVNTIDFVDEIETGAFMREALQGYDFDYYSDTVATTCIMNCGERFDLVDMIDYGVMVIGAEAGKWDDIGIDPSRNGILDTLAYYMSIGGKVVMFGRWGDIVECDTVDYLFNAYTYDNAYLSYFHIYERVRTTTEWPFLSTVITSDLVGARSEDANYPNLVWDSLVTLAHANANNATITEVAGIPCASFVSHGPSTPEVIYSYDSRDDDPVSEGKPVAWRYVESDRDYIWFEIPLSMFERGPAIAALTQAVDELLDVSTHAEENPSGEGLPNEFGLRQNYPNPFNPVTEICYSLPSASKVNLSIFNILGQKVTTLVNEDQVAGSHTVQWPGTDDGGQSVATGIYLYRLTAGEFTESKKMLLLK